MDKIAKEKSLPKERNNFTRLEKHQIIQEYLSGRYSKQEIWRKYTGNAHHGRLLIWMRQLGYEAYIKNERSSIAPMSKEKIKDEALNVDQDDSTEKPQLEKRIIELEKQLKEAELKAIAFSTMVDIAEREFKIPIRKKYNTKP